MELIPFEKVEVIFNLPPYLAHNNPAVHDGFGDVAFLIKYRLLSANEEHGNSHSDSLLGLECTHWFLYKRFTARNHHADDSLRKGIRSL